MLNYHLKESKYIQSHLKSMTKDILQLLVLLLCFSFLVDFDHVLLYMILDKGFLLFMT